MKKIILVGLLFCMGWATNAQYRNYRKEYNVKEYDYQEGDRYNPTVAGFGAIFPGAGHLYSQEALRGFLFFGGSAVSVFMISQGAMDGYASGYGGSSSDSKDFIPYLGLVSFVTIYTWNFFDAVKVAKIKNMHLRNHVESFQVLPYYESAMSNPTGSGIKGLSLCLLLH